MAEVVDVLLRARGEFSDLTGKISNLRKEFQNLKLPKDITENLEKGFNRLDPLLKSYQKQLNKGFKTKTDLKNFEAMRSELDAVFGDITSEIQKVNGQPIQLKADLKEITALEKKLDTLEKQLQTKLDNITIDKSGKVAKDINTLISVADKAIKPMTSKAQSLFDAQDFVAFNAELDKIQNKILSLSNKSGAKIDLARSLGFKGELFDKEGNIITAQLTKVDTLIKKFFSGLKVSDSSLTGLEKTNRDILQTGEALSQIKTDSLTRGAQAISTLGVDAAQASKGAKELSQSILDAGSSTVRMADELSQLQSSTQYFFSLRNMINLFKRGVREAVDTVKELDAAMTETAVVTNYSVSDMWKKLPEYTANAKALGSTIQQMYEATTLYYQQGLNDTQAMGIANETMKMARIGGLEAADATDKMTAALRGFNMEINEISAQRVNDVYSNLAAKTASNTEELGTAMQRTASIAASAGMSFEGTAAFLAQAIETTREPAENLGTAMKTIVARFTELKKNPLEISEVDGEEVDYNKVDAALKSIGVSLKDTNGQFRALDEVFLDISQRWDSLTQTQQRYVATQAAGSRQQSRFIAMMSNYNRTLELMDYANNSAGASIEQFNKTMDSLEAKLNIFKDTWQEFLMGIANEEVIKKTIGGANLALTTLNKIINAISKATGPMSGLTKSVLSLGTAFFGLRSFGRLANGMIRGFGGMLNPSTSFGEQFKLGVLNSRNSLQAAAISNPIVNAIRELHPLINKAANHPNNQAGSGNLKGAQQALAEELYGPKATLLNGSSRAHMSPNYTPQALLDIIGANGLTPIQQKQLFDRNPGLKKNLKKSLRNLLEEVGADKKTKEGLVKGFTSGKMPLEDVLKSPKLRKTWGEQYQDILNKYGQDAWAKGGEGRQAINDLKLRAKAASVKDFQKGGALYNSIGDEYRSSAQSWLNSTQEFSKQEQVMQKIANNAQKISGGMMAAGAAFSMIGSIVGESNEELGQTLSTIGMITTAVGTLGMTFSTFMNMNPILMGISLAIGAAIGAATILKKRTEDIKKAGQEVVNTYKEINSTTEENISTLKSYYEQVEHWSKGVDEFGNNVNLSDEEYAAYRDAVNKIAEINPGIVEGYNAQGKAIIDINKALKETIRLEKQRQQNAIDEYLDKGSFDKIIKARNVDDNFQKATKTLKFKEGSFAEWFFGEKGNFGINVGKWFDTTFDTEVFTKKVTPFTDNVATIINSLQADLGDEKLSKVLEPFNIDLDQLLKGDATAIRQLVAQRDKIYTAALDASKDGLSQKTTQVFNTLDDTVKTAEEAIEPTLEWLQTYVSQSTIFKELPNELKSSVMAGLKEIALDPTATFDSMQSEAIKLANGLKDLTKEGTAYSYVMEDVAKHQEQFANDLNEAAYFDNIKDDLEDLDALMKEYENDTTAYGRAVYEFLTNQKAAIKNFTSSGETFLADAINEMTGVIAEAEGAYESFQEATKTDYSTGKSSMKSIYDELFAETDGIQLHLQGSGDKTLWKGAEALLGREFIETNNYKDVVNALKNLGPYLKEGQEGFDNFWNAFMQIDPDKIDGLKIDKEKGTYDIEDSKAEEVYKAIAKEMKMSESFLMSMLNAGRQYASINFSNDEKIRKALATDESVIRGKDGTLFTTNDYLNTALSEGGITVPKEQQEWKEQHQDKVNLVTIDNLDELSDANLEQMGITDMRSAIEVLGKTGLFQSDQIEEVAKKFADYNAEDYEGAWQQYLDREADPTLAPIESIEANVASIASSVARNDVAQGKVTQADLDKAADFREKIKGGVGVDTATQYFGKGLDEYGTVLTSDQYKKGKANLEEGLEYANQWKEAFQEAADNATDPKKQKQYQQAADNYAAAAETIQNNLNAVDKNYAEAYANYQKELTTQRYMADGKSLSEAKTAAEEVYNKAFEDATAFIKNGGVGDLDETVYTKEEAQRTPTEGSENNVNTKDLEAKRKELEQVFNLLTTGPWADGFQGLDLNAIIQSEDKIAALNNISSAIEQGIMPNLSDLDTLGVTDSWKQVADKYADSIAEGAQDVDTNNVNESGKTAGSNITNSFVSGVERAEAHDANIETTGKDKGQKQLDAHANGIERAEAHDRRINNSGSTSSSSSASLPPGVLKAEQHDSRITVNADAQTDNAEQKLTEFEEKVLELKTLTEEGVTFSIEVSGVKDITKAATAAKTITANTGDKNFSVTANTGTSKQDVEDLKTSISGLSDKQVSVTASVSGLSKAEDLNKAVQKFANFKSSYTINLRVNGSGKLPSGLYTGQNNKIFYTHVPTAGSVATGTKKGRVGPRGQGGLTLTGELGYEIAWLPDENRSIILGAKGPQMINLPNNAIVYNHEQSKDIMKKRSNTIAGSMHGGSYTPSRNNWNFSSSSSRSSSRSSSSGSSGSSSSSSSSNTTINHFSIEEVVRFNLDKKIEAMTSKIKKLTEEIDKNLKRIGTTALDITDSTQEQIKNLKSIKAFNDSLIASYQKDIDTIDKNKYMMQVSYTDDNGDKQDYTFDAQWYMYQTDGMPFLNDSAIRQLGSPGLEKAVTDAMKGLIDPLISGLQKARDAADDAQKQIEDLAEKFADTFYGWKNELTEIYDLTQRIENETSFTDRFASQIELELSKLGTGFGETEKAISNINAVLNRNNQTLKDQIENTHQLINARKRELDNALSAQDELDKIDAYRNSEAYAKASDEERNAVIRKLTDEYDVAANALAYVKNVTRELDGSVTYDIDWEGFEEANRQNPLNEETYKAIKEYLDSLNDATTEYNGSIKDTTDLLKQTYDDLKKYQDTIVDFEGDLLKGVEEQIKNDTENAKKLSDSISNALKDLLDEVKRKLDERRKQEDNAKTERDIAQKQQRLAALRANTSGGNQVEIAQLEKEIADAQQSYGRTLEDQLLDRLQQQGDEAKLQRERQIELAEISNEIGIANNKELVNSWLQNPELYKEQIKAAWLEAQGYDEKGYAEQQSLLNQWDTKWTNLLTAIEQTGFNESTKNIEDNTYTLVKLLADATGAVVDVTERNTETLKDLTKDVEGAKKAYSKGVDAKTLKDKFGFDATTLAGGGYTPSDLRRAGFGVGDLVNAGITDVKTLKDAGFNDATAIKTALGEANAKGISDYKSAGFTAKDLKGLFNDAELIDLFDAKALKDAQFTASELKGKFNILQLKDAGYTLPQLKDAFEASEFGAGGISYADARTVFTAQQLKNVAQYAKQAAAELQPKVSQGRDLAYGSQGSDVKLLQQTLNKLGIRDNSGNSLDVDGDFGQHTREAVINFQKKYRNKASKTLSADGVVGYYTKEAFKALGYKTGGLADYTGPAWLDGTPSKPELVLNATDTKNFLALRDVLSSAMKSTGAVNNSYGGDITYEVNINVDKLTSDYDVDKVADRVKKIIVKDAGYRNVTQVRNFR